MSSVKNGNKPYEDRPGEFRSEFTARVAAHPRVAYLPIHKTELMFMMVIDELLVRPRRGDAQFEPPQPSQRECEARRASPGRATTTASRSGV